MSDNWAGDGQERLLARVREYVLQGDEASVEQVLTNCTKLLRHLTHENAVLREFVAARDAVNCHDNETAPWVFEDRMELLEVEADLRVRLAEQFGVRLP